MEKGATAKPADGPYLEDIVIGVETETAGRTISQADIDRFSEVTGDYHPIHSDEEFCRNTPHGRPIAHGLFGLAVMEGLTMELKLYERSIGSLGWDKVRFIKPLFPGDTVRAVQKFIDRRQSSKPDRGVVRELVRLVNQKGEVVTEGEHASLFLRNPAAPASD